ncbi:MAG: iron-sulfur cluster carrier protein ApbC [Legionellales bacterium]
MQLQEALGKYREPYLGCDLVSAKVLQKCEQSDDGQINLVLQLGFPAARYAEELKQNLTQYLQQTLSLEKKPHIEVQWKIVPHQVQQGQQGHPPIKNIIAVASGKGGVGKSTVAVNLALALQAEGARVGILDADIYGPSQPWMLGVKQVPEAGNAPKKVLPVQSHGLYSMSIGYWVDNEQPMIWRGPMVSGALGQLLNDTEWPELDYLVVDLPPGTGDIQLTMAQKIPVSGAVIVTTPQDLAVLDARKAYGMLQKVGITVLGVVENMSYYECSQCGHHDAIFGSKGGEHMAEQYGIPLLGQLPLNTLIREQADSGVPIVVAYPDSKLTQLYLAMARQVAAKLSLQPRNYGQLFGEIKVTA